jgi:hypothetical protein
MIRRACGSPGGSPVGAERGRGEFKVEPMAFSLNLVLAPFGVAAGFQAVWLSLLLVGSQMANSAGFFFERLRQLSPDTRKKKEPMWNGEFVFPVIPSVDQPPARAGA